MSQSLRFADGSAPRRAEARNELPRRAIQQRPRVVAGIINTEGAMWKDQRRFLHEKLRNFGMTNSGTGKKIMEARIMVSARLSTRTRRFRIRPNRPNSILSFHQRPRETSDTVSECILSVAISRSLG